MLPIFNLGPVIVRPFHSLIHSFLLLRLGVLFQHFYNMCNAFTFSAQQFIKRNSALHKMHWLKMNRYRWELCSITDKVRPHVQIRFSQPVWQNILKNFLGFWFCSGRRSQRWPGQISDCKEWDQEKDQEEQRSLTKEMLNDIQITCSQSSTQNCPRDSKQSSRWRWTRPILLLSTPVRAK